MMTDLRSDTRALPPPAPPLFFRFATSWLLASLTLCIIPPLFFFFWLFGRLSRRYIKEQLAASARANTVAEECFANLRTVRSFAKEAAMLGSYEAAQERTLHYGLRSARLEGFFFPLNSSLATGDERQPQHSRLPLSFLPDGCTAVAALAYLFVRREGFDAPNSSVRPRTFLRSFDACACQPCATGGV
jgi:ABC-type multidrug transport system fused ATPase/permease subunit